MELLVRPRRSAHLIETAILKAEAGSAGGSAVAATVRALASMIAEGHWSQGSALPPQRELARLLDISRATLREAISVLLTTGKIKAQDNGRGFVIADGSDERNRAWPKAAPYSLDEVYQLRHERIERRRAA